MEKNEIKKALYKQNPPAEFTYYRKGIFYYDCNFMNYIGEDYSKGENIYLRFQIPIEDIGDASFDRTVLAKLLIRWIVE